MSMSTSKATEGRGGVSKALRKEPGGGSGTVGYGVSCVGGGKSVRLMGGVESEFLPRMETGGGREEEEPSVALGSNCGGVW